MAEGILILNPENAWSRYIPFKLKRIFHWILQVIGAILGVSGAFLIISRINRKHFVTTHGVLGYLNALMKANCSLPVSFTCFRHYRYSDDTTELTGGPLQLFLSETGKGHRIKYRQNVTHNLWNIRICVCSHGVILWVSVLYIWRGVDPI